MSHHPASRIGKGAARGTLIAALMVRGHTCTMLQGDLAGDPAVGSREFQARDSKRGSPRETQSEREREKERERERDSERDAERERERERLRE